MSADYPQKTKRVDGHRFESTSSFVRTKYAEWPTIRDLGDLTPNFVCAVTTCAIFALQVGSDADGVAADTHRLKLQTFFRHLISHFLFYSRKCWVLSAEISRTQFRYALPLLHARNTR